MIYKFTRVNAEGITEYSMDGETWTTGIDSTKWISDETECEHEVPFTESCDWCERTEESLAYLKLTSDFAKLLDASRELHGTLIMAKAMLLTPEDNRTDHWYNNERYIERIIASYDAVMKGIQNV